MNSERFALVTGAGSGIGKASALALARAGWHVALTGRRGELLEEVAGEIKTIGRRAFAAPRDVADPEAVKALFALSSESSAASISCSTTPAGARPRFRSTNCPTTLGRRWSTSISMACSSAPRPHSAS